MNPQQALQRLDTPPQAMVLDAHGRKAAIDDLINKVALVQEVMQRVMHEGEHYGKIPGCGDKPALLKAGAEKLGMTFRIRPQFIVNERDLGRGHREYSIICNLSDGTQGVGSCSTMETKYRFRGGERKCPECGKAAIIKGKAEYGGGYICFAKKGGCGAKFAEDDASITNQPLDRVEHDNPADFYNTCLKMGKKRAHVDAIITATACSDIFTQDIEEMMDMANNTNTPKPAAASQKKEAAAKSVPAKQTNGGTAAMITEQTVLPMVTVIKVTERNGVNSKTGKAWKAFFVTLDDEVGVIEAATFSESIGKFAKELADTHDPSRAVVKPGTKPGSVELVEIKRQEPPDDTQPELYDAEPIQEVVP